MSTTTPNLGLVKPAGNERPLVSVINGNMDAIDTAAGLMAVPIGTILDFAGTTAPTGYLECDGSAVSRSTYSALFAIIGTTWGTGDGSTTFNLPNLGGRTCIGKGSRAVGNTGGSETHTLTTSEIPSHKHSVGAHAHGLNSHKHKYDKVNSPTGGTAISVDQMPSHAHEDFDWDFVVSASFNSGNYNIPQASNGNAGTYHDVKSRQRDYSANTGGGKAHSHTTSTTSTDSGASSGNTANSTAFDSGATGGGSSMSIMQPYAVVKKIIRAL